MLEYEISTTKIYSLTESHKNQIELVEKEYRNLMKKEN